ncbi:MAG: hypothetical protein HY823_10390 [Acidobacteria bacterium]|nr:hypothetical protein [Acidobacteriota bacterium]
MDHAAWEPGGLLGFRDAAKTLRLRALLRLTQGTPEGAAGDVGTCLRIAEHLKGEPELIPLLLRTSLVGLVLQPVWEGLADHRWGEAQLSEIQALLTGVDLLSSARLAWEGERLHGIDVLRSVVEAGVGPFQLSKEAISTRDRLAASTGIVGRLYRGWIYRNLLELARFETELTIDVFPKGGRRVLTKGGTPQSRMAAFERRHRDLALARLAMPALLAQVQRIAHLQASVDLAGVACALERHRLARGDFPERLEVLVPEFIRELPRDLVTGGPLVYRRTPEGAFVLYSTGWDGKDQGGVLGRSKEDPRTLDPATGDWPWFAQAQ